MSAVQILSLLLALSAALHLATAAALIARRTGADPAHAILTGAGAAATALGLYFAAVTAYQ
ncbi:hypothetical protein AB0C84_35980 [Actinomadura sp. NPDC048955]|uniref:hypothetical protein n=1 Tax=Actinomadura sp. NPDC048955 TaxID=3158228 RepID=UPI003410AC86